MYLPRYWVELSTFKVVKDARGILDGTFNLRKSYGLPKFRGNNSSWQNR